MRISKSKFVAGVQWLKRLYFQVHRPELAEGTAEAAEAVMEHLRPSVEALPAVVGALHCVAHRRATVAPSDPPKTLHDVFESTSEGES